MVQKILIDVSDRGLAMNKIICDICGSTYPETADQCPICGSSREFALESVEIIPDKMPEYIPDAKKTGFFSAAAKMAREGLYEMDDPASDPPLDILPDIDNFSRDHTDICIFRIYKTKEL